MLLTRIAPSCARFSDTSLRCVSFQAAEPCMEEAPSDASWCEARSRLPQKLLPELVQQSTRRLQKCGKAVFASTDDPDYRNILKTFEPIHQLLQKRPRADMDNFILLQDNE